MGFLTLSRRGFMVAASALAASVGIGNKLVTLIETENETPIQKYSDWITDRGDYYIVRIPHGKSFSNHTFDKSVAFYMENDTTVSNVSVNGFTNLIMQQKDSRVMVRDSLFDSTSTKLASGKSRAVVLIDGSLDQSVFTGLHVQPGPSNDCCIRFHDQEKLETHKYPREYGVRISI